MQRAIINQSDAGFSEAERDQPRQIRSLYNDAVSPCWTTGIAAIDHCLPMAGLSRAGLHEIEPLRPSSMPFMTGFVFGLLSRLSSHKPVIWCVTTAQIGEYGHPYAFGLERKKFTKNK